MEKKSIGQLISILRKAKGMTQQQVADLLQVSNKTISKWETEETQPDINAIPVLAEIFNVTCDELLNGKLNTYSPESQDVLSNQCQTEFSKKSVNRLINGHYGKLVNLLTMLMFVSIGLGLASTILMFFGYVPTIIAIVLLIFNIASLGVSVTYALSFYRTINHLNYKQFEIDILKLNKNIYNLIFVVVSCLIIPIVIFILNIFGGSL